MFKESYERKLKGNSLILSECDQTKKENTFEERMITENSIRGFLPCVLRMTDEGNQFIYDITSKQNYCLLFEEKELKENDIRKLISGIVNVRAELYEYLLSDDNLILNPQFLYADPETKVPSFVFYPYYCTNINESLNQLALFILEKTDHKDKKAVELAYGFYKLILKEEYSFEKLLNNINNENNITNDKKDIIEDVEKIEEKVENDELESQIDFDFSTNSNKESTTEKIVLAICTIMLLLLIGLIAAIKIWRLDLYVPVSNKLMIVCICILGGLSVAVPTGLLIDRIGKDKRRRQLMQISDEIYLSEEQKRNEKFYRMNKSIGKTEEINECNKDIKRLVCYEGSEVYEMRIDKSPFIIGKSKKDVDGYLNNPGASRIHAKILIKDNLYIITDCNSTNGTSVNKRELSANESVKLHDNDEVSFAGQVFYFR